MPPPNRPCRTSVRSADNPTRAESRLRERWMHGAQAFRLDIRCFERITRHSENARLRKGRAGLENWQDSSRETPVTAVETSSHARPLGRTVGLTDNCPAKRVPSRCGRRTAPTLLFAIRVPNGALPFVSTVFGNSPEPQIVNDPKSLYQSPSGAHGPAFTQSCNRRRSWREIRRSSTWARMCSQTGCGRLENRIFGNGVVPEDCPDQILPRFALALGIGLIHETAIRRVEILARCRFSLHSALREHNQGSAHRKMLFPGHTLDLNCQLRRNRDALADGWRRSSTCA